LLLLLLYLNRSLNLQRNGRRLPLNQLRRRAKPLNDFPWLLNLIIDNPRQILPQTHKLTRIAALTALFLNYAAFYGWAAFYVGDFDAFFALGYLVVDEFLVVSGKGFDQL
jgi:hypothetical protein